MMEMMNWNYETTSVLLHRIENRNGTKSNHLFIGFFCFFVVIINVLFGNVTAI
jgi:hypothetical protein